jgi:hypothetical protein
MDAGYGTFGLAGDIALKGCRQSGLQMMADGKEP